jgi:hypothetical protein
MDEAFLKSAAATTLLWPTMSKNSLFCGAPAELLARIRPLVDARPSYGYRRITALLNRQAKAVGQASANHMA